MINEGTNKIDQFLAPIRYEKYNNNKYKRFQKNTAMVASGNHFLGGELFGTYRPHNDPVGVGNNMIGAGGEEELNLKS